MSILNWSDFELCMHISSVDRIPGMYLHTVQQLYIDVPVELSLNLLPLLISNCQIVKEPLFCLSETIQDSAQIWASLVHFKSRL